MISVSFMPMTEFYYRKPGASPRGSWSWYIAADRNDSSTVIMSKTKIIVFAKLSSQFSWSVPNNSIKQGNSFPFLGVYCTANYSWQAHWESMLLWIRHFGAVLLQLFCCQCGELFSQCEAVLSQNHFCCIVWCEYRVSVKYLSKSPNRSKLSSREGPRAVLE